MSVVDCGDGDLTWMSMDWGVVLDGGYGWYKVLDSSLCSE